MDGRRGGGYSGRDRYPGRDGYGAYDYTYDYGSDPAGSYSSLPESWMTSYPMSHSDGATHMGSARESLYDRMDRSRYGYSEPQRGYGSWKEPRPVQQGWGGFKSNFGSPDAARRAGRPAPLFNPATLPEVAGFQSMRAFTGNSYFGGGFKQRTKKIWKERTAKKKIVKDGAPPEKKIRAASEDNGAKSEASESEGDEDTEGAGRTTKTERDDKEEEREEATKDGKEQKQTSVKKPQETQGRRLREKMVDRIQFVCSLCKFRTFYDEEMSSHLQSAFHKEHFHYVGGKLPKQSADFLQEYVLHKSKKTGDRRSTIENLSTTIQQIYRDQDLTQGVMLGTQLTKCTQTMYRAASPGGVAGISKYVHTNAGSEGATAVAMLHSGACFVTDIADLGMEHFMKKVEAAHCAACDIFIPMNFTALQRHLKSPLHNQNRRSMMENSKKTALAVAKSILNNKLISQKLESYIKGQNPFTDEYEENARRGIGTEVALEGQKDDLPSSSALPDSLEVDNSHVTASGESGDEREKEEDLIMQCENSEGGPNIQAEEQLNT